MVRETIALALVAVLAASAVHAQQPAKPPAPNTEKNAAKPPAPEGLPTNIKIELTITDQIGPAEPAKRTVNMVVADRKNGSIRSSGRVNFPGQSVPVFLNVDATPAIVKDGLMRIDLTLEYVPKATSEGSGSGAPENRGTLNQRMSLMVDSGKPIVISQASDPLLDRKITVELTATVVK
jgi:glucose/arabinose dehydrogenase